jgi:hypothetical protein
LQVAQEKLVLKRGAFAMKRRIGSGFAVLMAVIINAIFAGAAVTLTVLNPRGEITPPPLAAPSPRISDLASKKIAIYWNGKEGGDNFWSNVEALIKRKLPNTTVLRYNGPFDLGDAQAAKIAKETDAFLYGVGD